VEYPFGAQRAVPKQALHDIAEVERPGWPCLMGHCT
jgi:hypothetical protein